MCQSVKDEHTYSSERKKSRRMAVLVLPYNCSYGCRAAAGRGCSMLAKSDEETGRQVKPPALEVEGYTLIRCEREAPIHYFLLAKP